MSGPALETRRPILKYSVIGLMLSGATRPCLIISSISITYEQPHQWMMRVYSFCNLPSGEDAIIIRCTIRGCSCCCARQVKATFHYSTQLQTWSKTCFSTRFATRFSTSSCRFATRFRLFCRKLGREPAASISTCRDWCSRFAAGSLVRARARQMECRKKPVLNKFAAGFRHACDLLATRYTQVWDQVFDQVCSWLAKIMECGLCYGRLTDWCQSSMCSRWAERIVVFSRHWCLL